MNSLIARLAEKNWLAAIEETKNFAPQGAGKENTGLVKESLRLTPALGVTQPYRASGTSDNTTYV